MSEGAERGMDQTRTKHLKHVRARMTVDIGQTRIICATYATPSMPMSLPGRERGMSHGTCHVISGVVWWFGMSEQSAGDKRRFIPFHFTQGSIDNKRDVLHRIHHVRTCYAERIDSDGGPRLGQRRTQQRAAEHTEAVVCG